MSDRHCGEGKRPEGVPLRLYWRNRFWLREADKQFVAQPVDRRRGEQQSTDEKRRVSAVIGYWGKIRRWWPFRK